MKTNKPGFIRRWLARLWVQAQEDRCYEDESPLAIGQDYPATSNHFSRDRGFTFTVYAADRGHVVDVEHNDHKRDERVHKLYIITEDDDFGRQISKILTAEGLHR